MSKIIIVTPNKNNLSLLGISNWSPWECEPSMFDWEYDSEEWCYLFEGRAIIKVETGQEVEVKRGDLVKFPKGLKCKWNVIEKIKKVYTFI